MLLSRKLVRIMSSAGKSSSLDVANLADKRVADCHRSIALWESAAISRKGK